MPGKSSYVEMRHLLHGFATTATISAIVNLGVADHLADGPRSASELARLTGANEDFLRRVLRYLASEGIFAEEAGDMFALTELSQWLRTGMPGSLQPRASFIGSTALWVAWSKLERSLKSGRSGMQEAFGHSLFEFAKDDPETAAAFDTFMAGQTRASNAAVIGSYDFAGIKELADIGGGRGALIAGILDANPGMRGILFDMPNVVANAPAVLESAGVANRCRIASGSFFDDVPAGADAYSLKFILHDWSDDDCVRILSNCRRAMSLGGRILIIEHILPEKSGPDYARYMDINMLVMTEGGRERTRDEFTRLLAGAGLEIRSATPTDIGLWVLECKAAD
jgi:hypothetical protein